MSRDRYEVAERNDRLFGATALLLGALLLAGGTSRAANDLLCLLASLPALYVVLSGTRSAALEWPARLALALYGLAWLQLVPLPPDVWVSLPGRALAADILAVVGAEIGWRPLALDPGAAMAALLSLVAPLVLLVAFARLTEAEQRRSCVVVAFALVATFLGLAQRVTVPQSLRRRACRIRDRPVVIAIISPRYGLAMLWVPFALSGSPARHGAFIGSALVAIFAVGILASTSRAGIVLGVLASAASLLMLWRPSRMVVIAGGGVFLAVVVALLFVPALAPVFERFGSLGDDQRVTMARDSWLAGRTLWPWGSGFGSFADLYKRPIVRKIGSSKVACRQA